MDVPGQETTLDEKDAPCEADSWGAFPSLHASQSTQNDDDDDDDEGIKKLYKIGICSQVINNAGLCQSTRKATMSIVGLATLLGSHPGLPGQSDLGSVRHNDIITTVSCWMKDWLVLAHEDAG